MCCSFSHERMNPKSPFPFDSKIPPYFYSIFFIAGDVSDNLLVKWQVLRCPVCSVWMQAPVRNSVLSCLNSFFILLVKCETSLKQSIHAYPSHCSFADFPQLQIITMFNKICTFPKLYNLRI